MPPLKSLKRPLEDDDQIDSGGNKLKCHEITCIIDDKSSTQLIPVLADEYYKSIDTEQVFVAKVTNKKQTSRLLKDLCRFWPLPGLQHLKRVRRTSCKDVFEIILRNVTEDEKRQVSTQYEFELKDVLLGTDMDVTGLSEDVTILSVPTSSPLTHTQFKEASLHWPLQFREDKYIESILNGSIFNSEDVEKMKNHMKTAIEIANRGCVDVGAVVVDPVSGVIVAAAHDERQSHPLKHAVMVVIDVVATSQGGGTWQTKSSCDPLNADLIKSNTQPEKSSNIQTDLITDDSKKSLPYLCTSYDLYVTREPCVMCAMALVHSRIHRVFYGESVVWGGLGSSCKIHVLPGLNHHYEVWKDLLIDECTQLNIHNIHHS